MESEIVKSLTNNFEDFVQYTDEKIEFWLARDLQKLLGYAKWDNFLNVIEKAKTSCKNSKEDVNNHFAEVGKTIEMPKNATKEIDDIMLTRYACYLIAQNWDSKKEEIAFAQTYFAIQTRKAEIIEQKLLEIERVQSRNKLKETEKELSQVIFEQTKSDKNFALIRSKWDTAFFGWKSTWEMKKLWKIKETKPLADHLPTILLKAKDFATEITIFNAKTNKMSTEWQISSEHITNNTTVRNTLISRWIVPENLDPEEDISKVERKINSENKKTLKSAKGFKKNN